MDAVNQGDTTKTDEAQDTPTTDEKPQSILAIEFDSPGAAQFHVKMLNVAPGQLFAAAGYLRWMAEAEMTRIANQKPKIEIAR
jgi:hypothetical protein